MSCTAAATVRLVDITRLLNNIGVVSIEHNLIKSIDLLEVITHRARDGEVAWIRDVDRHKILLPSHVGVVSSDDNAFAIVQDRVILDEPCQRRAGGVRDVQHRYTIIKLAIP